MTVSSRTPEGSPNLCPVCGNFVCIEPSLPFGDAPCPSCGQLLWFLIVHSVQRYFLPEEADDVRDRVHDIVAANLGIEKEALLSNPAFLKDVGADSLDIAELMVELDEEFG